MIFYLCNQKRCGDKCSYPECKHTTDYAYALNKGVTPKIDDIFDEEYACGYNLIEKEERKPITMVVMSRGDGKSIGQLAKCIEHKMKGNLC